MRLVLEHRGVDCLLISRETSEYFRKWDLVSLCLFFLFVWAKASNSDVLMIFLFYACNTIDVTVAEPLSKLFLNISKVKREESCFHE